MNVTTEYADMGLKEQAGFISHAAAGLVDELYYNKDKAGLEAMMKNFRLIADHARDCLDCLELMGKEGDVLKKVRLLLEYLGMKDLTGDFVCELEELAVHAHEDYIQSTDGLISEEDEANAVELLKGLIKKHEEEDLKAISK